MDITTLEEIKQRVESVKCKECRKTNLTFISAKGNGTEYLRVEVICRVCGYCPEMYFGPPLELN